ncbi:DNA N-6-adenine-methyltransferase [Vibrio cholerae]
MRHIEFSREVETKTLDDKSNSWATPYKLFQVLHERFKFDVDACANDINHKLPTYWTIEDDALNQSWEGLRVFCNPPYSDVAPFLSKGLEADLAVFILPVRIRTKYWRDIIRPYASEILYCTPSPKFLDVELEEQKTAPLDISVVVFGDKQSSCKFGHINPNTGDIDYYN